MARNNISRTALGMAWYDIRIAIALLTRLPLPSPDFNALGDRTAAAAAWAYPLVGLIVGGLGAAAIWATMAMGLPSAVAALFAIVLMVLVTGAMHEDGLADCADGFWGGWTVERRLEIMKDSQIGTYGVLALVCAICLRWVLLAALAYDDVFVIPLLCAAVMSRAVMVGVMFFLPHARATGLSRQTGQPTLPAVAGAAGVFGIALLFFAPVQILVSVCLSIAILGGMIWLAHTKIKGQTGDVLGATQVVGELVLLASFVAVLVD